jgi:prenyltransferase beta subunit
MTAAAILALKAVGLSSTDLQIQKALSYLKTTQNSDGGFAYDPTSSYGTASDSSSTAWVLWALNALNIDQVSWNKDGYTPFEYLTSTQIQNGSFEYQKGSGENSLSPTNTAYAVIALEGKSLPLKTISAFSPQFNFRIEGSNETVCEGKTSGPTALDIIKKCQRSVRLYLQPKRHLFRTLLRKN